MPWFLLSARATNTWTVRTPFCAASDAAIKPKNNTSARQWRRNTGLIRAQLAWRREDGPSEAEHASFRHFITYSTEAVIPALDERAQTFHQVRAFQVPDGGGHPRPGLDTR